MKSYREIKSWQKSMDLVTQLYKETDCFPDSEKFGLTNQIRRSSVSIPSNIAEGFGRNSLNEFIRFLNIARGSLFEMQTQIEIAQNLSFLEREIFQELIATSVEIEKLINGLINSLKVKLGTKH